MTSIYLWLRVCCLSKMSATEYLKKAVEYDLNGRKLESLKLYQSGISALLKTCKGLLFCKIQNWKNDLFSGLKKGI